MLFHFLCLVICKKCYSRVVSVWFSRVQWTRSLDLLHILPSYSYCTDRNQSTSLTVISTCNHRKPPWFNVSWLETIVDLVYMFCYGDIQACCFSWVVRQEWKNIRCLLIPKYKNKQHSRLCYLTSVTMVYVHKSLNAQLLSIRPTIMASKRATYLFPSASPAHLQKVPEVDKRNLTIAIIDYRN